MKLLHIGDGGLVGREVEAVARALGHEVASLAMPGAGDRGEGGRFDEVAKSPVLAGAYDACLDTSARDPRDVREAGAALAGRCAHYVLLSTCEVYPATARAKPWAAEEIDLTDDPGLTGLDARVREARGAERELRLGTFRSIKWTVLRPAIVEGGSYSSRLAWFVSRIVDEGPISLPDVALPTYRLVRARDVAAALVAVAGRSEAFGRTENVVGDGVFNYFGEAALVMEALGRRVHVVSVPARAWREEGLTLPRGETPSSSLVEASALLRELGWRPTPDAEWLPALARGSAGKQVDPEIRKIERRLAQETAHGMPPSPPPMARAKHWQLLGRPGEPASVRLEQAAKPPVLPPPILRTRRLAIGTGVQRMLLGQVASKWPGTRAIGHNAVLEVMEPGPTKLRAGGYYLPVAKMPCGDATCAMCARPETYVLGVDADGYGAELVTTPPQHLVEVSKELESIALLADPLASLSAALGAALKGDGASVWICGHSAQAALAGFLASDAGREVVHVDRPMIEAASFHERKMRDVEQAVEAALKGELERPAVVVETTGNVEMSRLMATALAPGGWFVGIVKPLNLQAKVRFGELASTAPDRAALVAALERLKRWTAWRDLASLVGPAVRPEAFWEAFGIAPFSLPYIDSREGA